MKILSTKKENALKKMKDQLEIASIFYTSGRNDFNKDEAIRKLNNAINDIFNIVGV